jgi:superoxide dismutase, Cu-Zn family
MSRTAGIVGAVLGLAFALPAQPAAGQNARAEIRNLEGQVVANAMLEDTPSGVLIRLTVTGLPTGTRSFHIHETGRCEPPFQSAGGHYNPWRLQHGFHNPRGYHAGDLPNLQIPESGRLEVQVFAQGLTLRDRQPNSLFDADGSALVIHQGVDDYRSDPAGNAGDRIACGVVVR